MKNLVYLLLVIIVLTASACSKDEAEDVVSNENPTVQSPSANDQPIEESKGGSQQDQNHDKEGVQGVNPSGEQQDEGKNIEALHINFEPAAKTWVINGALLGDTREQINKLLGQPLKAFGEERYDYSFFGGKLMVVFDDLGVSYFQADTTGEKGKLLDDTLIQDFASRYQGNIYKATDELAQQFNASSIVVFAVHSDSILVIEKHRDEKNGVIRSYMVAPEYSWSFSRGWDMNTFKDQTLFTQVNSNVAVKEQ